MIFSEKSATFRDHALGIKRARMIYPPDAHKAYYSRQNDEKVFEKIAPARAVCRNTLGN